MLKKTRRIKIKKIQLPSRLKIQFKSSSAAGGVIAFGPGRRGEPGLCTRGSNFCASPHVGVLCAAAGCCGFICFHLLRPLVLPPSSLRWRRGRRGGHVSASVGGEEVAAVAAPRRAALKAPPPHRGGG